VAGYQFGVVEWALPIPGPYGVRMAGEAGFSGMQLGDGGGSKKIFPFSHKRIQDAYLEAGAQYDIAFQAMHLYTLFRQKTMLYPSNTPEGDHARLSIDKAVGACKDMGIPAIMLTATRYREPEAYQNVVASLRYALDRGKEAGVRICMETDLSMEEIHRLREQTGGELTICFDTMNPLVYGIGNPWELMKQLGTDVIDHFHVKDCCQEGLVWGVMAPALLGQGVSGFEKSAWSIWEMGFEGWLISEVYYDVASINKDEDYVQLAAKDVDTLHRLFAN